MITQTVKQYRKNIRQMATRERIAFILMILFAMPLVAGCKNAPENNDMVAQRDSALAQVSQLQSENKGLQSNLTDAQNKLTAQQNVVADLSKSPQNAPWYQRFLDWLTKNFGQWIADKVVEYVGDFLAAVALM